MNTQTIATAAPSAFERLQALVASSPSPSPSTSPGAERPSQSCASATCFGRLASRSPSLGQLHEPAALAVACFHEARHAHGAHPLAHAARPPASCSRLAPPSPLGADERAGGGRRSVSPLRPLAHPRSCSEGLGLGLGSLQEQIAGAPYRPLSPFRDAFAALSPTPLRGPPLGTHSSSVPPGSLSSPRGGRRGSREGEGEGHSGGRLRERLSPLELPGDGLSPLCLPLLEADAAVPGSPAPSAPAASCGEVPPLNLAGFGAGAGLPLPRRAGRGTPPRSPPRGPGARGPARGGGGAAAGGEAGAAGRQAAKVRSTRDEWMARAWTGAMQPEPEPEPEPDAEAEPEPEAGPEEREGTQPHAGPAGDDFHDALEKSLGEIERRSASAAAAAAHASKFASLHGLPRTRPTPAGPPRPPGLRGGAPGLAARRGGLEGPAGRQGATSPGARPEEAPAPAAVDFAPGQRVHVQLGERPALLRLALPRAPTAAPCARLSPAPALDARRRPRMHLSVRQVVVSVFPAGVAEVFASASPQAPPRPEAAPGTPAPLGERLRLEQFRSEQSGLGVFGVCLGPSDASPKPAPRHLHLAVSGASEGHCTLQAHVHPLERLALGRQRQGLLVFRGTPEGEEEAVPAQFFEVHLPRMRAGQSLLLSLSAPSFVTAYSSLSHPYPGEDHFGARANADRAQVEIPFSPAAAGSRLYVAVTPSPGFDPADLASSPGPESSRSGAIRGAGGAAEGGSPGPAEGGVPRAASGAGPPCASTSLPFTVSVSVDRDLGLSSVSAHLSRGQFAHAAACLSTRLAACSGSAPPPSPRISPAPPPRRRRGAAPHRGHSRPAPATAGAAGAAAPSTPAATYRGPLSRHRTHGLADLLRHRSDLRTHVI
eukprot:tig00001231_g7654.t1